MVIKEKDKVFQAQEHNIDQLVYDNQGEKTNSQKTINKEKDATNDSQSIDRNIKLNTPLKSTIRKHNDSLKPRTETKKHKDNKENENNEDISNCDHREITSVVIKGQKFCGLLYLQSIKQAQIDMNGN